MGLLSDFFISDVQGFQASLSAEMQRDLIAMFKDLKKVSANYRKDRREILVKVGKFASDAIRNTVPVSRAKHSRYKTFSSYRGKRSSEPVATYYPGNLKRSIRPMFFRNSKSAIFVGARFAPRDSSGIFKGNRVDGYYWRFVEDNPGTNPFFRNAANSLSGAIYDRMISLSRQSINKAIDGISS